MQHNHTLSNRIRKLHNHHNHSLPHHCCNTKRMGSKPHLPYTRQPQTPRHGKYNATNHHTQASYGPFEHPGFGLKWQHRHGSSRPSGRPGLSGTSCPIFMLPRESLYRNSKCVPVEPVHIAVVHVEETSSAWATQYAGKKTEKTKCPAAYTVT